MDLGDWDVDLVDSASLLTRCLDQWLTSIVNIALKLHSEESKFTSAFASVYFPPRAAHAPLVHFHWTWTWAESVDGHLVLKSPSSRPSPSRLSPPWTWPWPGGLEWSPQSPQYPESRTYTIVQYKSIFQNKFASKVLFGSIVANDFLQLGVFLFSFRKWIKFVFSIFYFERGWWEIQNRVKLMKNPRSSRSLIPETGVKTLINIHNTVSHYLQPLG